MSLLSGLVTQLGGEQTWGHQSRKFVRIFRAFCGRITHKKIKYFHEFQLQRN